MKVFIAGATGVLGRRLVRLLVAKGHSVVGLARTPEKASVVRSLGGNPVRADLFDPRNLASAMKGADVVVRAATSIPTKMRPGRGDFAMNDRIRTEGTRAITTAATVAGAPTYVHESISWAVGSRDGSVSDETAPPNPNPALGPTLEGERLAIEAADRLGLTVAILRCGSFYASDAAHTRIMGERLLRRKLPVIGDGRATWSLVHVDDVASAFSAVVESPRIGIWHVVDDRPVTMEEFFTELANRLGAPPPRRVPVWLASLFAGRVSVEFLQSSFPTSNARLKRDYGWRPAFPTIKEGLEQVVAAWKAERFLQAAA